jgi:hypothetical protein
LQRDARQLLGGDAVVATDPHRPFLPRRRSALGWRSRVPWAFRPWRVPQRH